jgi:hypothetical protein
MLSKTAIDRGFFEHTAVSIWHTGGVILETAVYGGFMYRGNRKPRFFIQRLLTVL